MCGRYVITSPGAALAALFGVEERLNLPARHNVAPTQDVPIVRAADGRRSLSLARWGLIPVWAKAPFEKRGIASATLINARSDTVAEKPAFRSAFRARRCLMPADGFYEWREDVKPKQPYRIGLADSGNRFRPFAIAGLWERWTGEVRGEARTVESCALITSDAAPAVAFIHHRMPVILDPADWDRWLDPATSVDELRPLLRPTGAPLAWHPVSRRVNAVSEDDAELLEPVPETLPETLPVDEPQPERSGSSPESAPRAAGRRKAVQGSLL